MNIMIHANRTTRPVNLWRLLLEENESREEGYLPDSDQDRSIISRLRDVLALR